MKDIKTISLELNVSRQTVYNHISKNDKELKGCILKKQGVTFLTNEGVRILKESMGLIKAPKIQQNIGMEEIIEQISENVQDKIKESMLVVKEDIVLQVEDSKKSITENIKEDYTRLEKELEEVKKQNEVLINMLKDQIEKQEQKKGFFGIFRKK